MIDDTTFHYEKDVSRLTWGEMSGVEQAMVLGVDDGMLSISAGSSLLASFLRQRAEDEAEFAKLSDPQRGAEARPARSRAGTSECGAWMPRARSYCLLPPNHAGRHRSKGNRR